jgi:hypothetical protein
LGAVGRGAEAPAVAESGAGGGQQRLQKSAGLEKFGERRQAIAEALKGVGFDVTLKLDASRAEMGSLMQSYAQTLATKKCVGLFVGHGVQLAWRNYLVPVEAAIDKMDDVRFSAEVGSPFEGISKAANPMGVIILMPAGTTRSGATSAMRRKGLSQIDAPPATFLAYATSPGHVAGDGGDEERPVPSTCWGNQVRDAKIEDVFARTARSTPKVERPRSVGEHFTRGGLLLSAAGEPENSEEEKEESSRSSWPSGIASELKILATSMRSCRNTRTG